MEGEKRITEMIADNTKSIMSFWAAFILSVLLYSILAFVLFSSFPNIYAIKCDLILEEGGKVQVFYKGGLRDDLFFEKYSNSSPSVEENNRTLAVVLLPDSPVESIRIDPGPSEGITKLFSIELVSHFAKRKKIGPREIISLFKPGTDYVSMALMGDHVAIKSDKKDPYIVSKKPLLDRSWFFILGLPLPFSLLCLFILSGSRFNCMGLLKIPNVGEKIPTAGSLIYSLNGLRGLAAMMVVADHCWGRFMGLGISGVWIFMSLSGFLLCRPFASSPGQIVSKTEMVSFFKRRWKRIVPIYFSYIAIVYLVPGRFDEGFKHLLFLQGAGHLWVVPQEMTFYLIIPIVLLVNFFVFKGNCLLSFLFTASLAVAANCYFTADLFFLYGMYDLKLRLFIGVFLTGVASGYAYELILKTQLFHRYRRKIAFFCSLTGAVLLCFFLLCSTGRFWGGVKVYSQLYFGWFGLVSALLILCVVFSDNTFLERMLTNKLLCQLGVVSFSLYIFHPLVLGMISKGQLHFVGTTMSGPFLFILTLIFSFYLACFTYKYIEKPCMGIGRP